MLVFELGYSSDDASDSLEFPVNSDDVGIVGARGISCVQLEFPVNSDDVGISRSRSRKLTISWNFQSIRMMLVFVDGFTASENALEFSVNSDDVGIIELVWPFLLTLEFPVNSDDVGIYPTQKPVSTG